MNRCRRLMLLALLGLAGCAATAPRDDPCAQGEATYPCQIYRYQNVSA